MNKYKDKWDYALKNKMKAGDIIYPHWNGTANWNRRTRWDVIIKISKTELETSCLYNYSSVRTIEVIKRLSAIVEERRTSKHRSKDE